MGEQTNAENDYQAKLKTAKAGFEREIMTLKRLAGELDIKLNILHRENENLNLELQEKSSELESWITKYHTMEVELTSQNKNVVYRFEEYKKAYPSLDLETKFKAERTSYETQIVQLKQRVTEYEELNKVLAADAKKLAKSNSEKFKELDSLRAEYTRMENEHYKETHESRVQMDRFKRSSLDVQEITTRHSSEVSKLEGHISQLEQTNANLKEELKKVYDLLERRKLDDSKNVRTIEELRLQIASHAAPAEAGENSEYIAELEERLASTEEDRKRLEEMYQKNALELSSKNDELIQKIRELEGLRQKYEASLHDLGNVKSKLSYTTVIKRNHDY
jgi:chromosome segregation ATPase